eukprot:3076764-Amphidinium_carterae.2
MFDTYDTRPSKTFGMRLPDRGPDMTSAANDVMRSGHQAHADTRMSHHLVVASNEEGDHQILLEQGSFQTPGANSFRLSAPLRD